MRTAAAIVLAGLVAASLAACTSAPSTGDCVPTPSGSISDSVKVTGEFGTAPTVEFTSPLAPEATQRTVVTPADKREQFAQVDDEGTFNFVLYDGTTGAELTSSYADGKPAAWQLNEEVFLPGLVKTLLCSAPGDRVVGVIPAADAFGANGSEALGVAAGESLVFVVDFISIAAGKATGEAQAPVEGMPTVTLAADGTPTITIPDAEPPAELELAVLIKGEGAVVGEGDGVRLNYVGMNWNTKTVFDESWSKSPVTFATNGVIEGFGQALVGQTVGSQVIVVIPPDLGYGPVGGNEGAGISATDTLVFVIDILGTTPAG